MRPSISESNSKDGSAGSVLCVDLDGTLIAGDTLWRTVVLVVRTSPLYLFLLPFWLARGRAYIKARSASIASPNPSVLRYHKEVIDYLKYEKAAGREIILVTGANRRIAESVAQHLGLFTAVLASDERKNLVGPAKVLAIRELLADAPFCYLGNSRADIPVWANADGAMLLNPSPTLLAEVMEQVSVEKVFTTNRSSVAHFWKLIRPHHWTKNVLLIVPLITSHTLGNLQTAIAIFAAIAAFSLAASAGYVINDILDVRFDRLHQFKYLRPIASGHVGLWTATMLPIALLAGSGTIALVLLPITFTSMLLIYVVASIIYSLFAKRVAILDVLVLAGLYTLRVIAGGAAFGIVVSPWLLGFSMFQFLSLAFLKRYSELARSVESSGDIEGRGYSSEDRQMIGFSGMVAGYIAIVVFALYINSADATLLYTKPQVLWLACPILLYWIQRLWLLAFRGVGIGDPVVFALRDKVSYVVGVLAALVLWLASS